MTAYNTMSANIMQIMEVLLDLIEPEAATADNLQKVGRDLLRYESSTVLLSLYPS